MQQVRVNTWLSFQSATTRQELSVRARRAGHLSLAQPATRHNCRAWAVSCRVMTRTQFIAALARRFPPLTEQDAALSVQYILHAIAGALVQGGRVEVRGFGSFSVRTRPPRDARNPKTGEAVAVVEKRVPHFLPAKELRQRVDRSSHL